MQVRVQGEEKSEAEVETKTKRTGHKSLTAANLEEDSDRPACPSNGLYSATSLAIHSLADDPSFSCSATT